MFLSGHTRRDVPILEGRALSLNGSPEERVLKLIITHKYMNGNRLDSVSQNEHKLELES